MNALARMDTFIVLAAALLNRSRELRRRAEAQYAAIAVGLVLTIITGSFALAELGKALA